MAPNSIRDPPARDASLLALRLTSRNAPAMAGSGFWHSLLGLDRAGNPLTPVYTWADARCAPQTPRGCAKSSTNARSSSAPAACYALPFGRRNCSGFAARSRDFFGALPAGFRLRNGFSRKFSTFAPAVIRWPAAPGSTIFSSADWDDELLELIGLTSDAFQSAARSGGESFSRDRRRRRQQSRQRRNHARRSSRSISARAPPFARCPPPETKLPFGLFRFAVDQHRPLLGGAVSNAGNLRAWCVRELRLAPNDRAIERHLRANATRECRLTILPFWVSGTCADLAGDSRGHDRRAYSIRRPQQICYAPPPRRSVTGSRTFSTAWTSPSAR